MKFLSAMLAGLYGFILRIRHLLFDAKVIKRYKADIPVVCVGNITVGGTGKTPVTEHLVRLMGKRYNIAVLSRGYGRKTKGYIEVQTNSSFLTVGDEPKQIKRKFPDTLVVVCENRVNGIERIRTEHPEINLIILDDGFQHRRVEPQVNIILADYTRPIWEDHLLPWGNLRDLPSQLHRANIIIVTKTPEDITPIDKRIVVKHLKMYPYQRVFFTSMRQDEPIAMFPEAEELIAPHKNAAVLAAIGNPRALIDSLEKRFKIHAKWLFRDHHVYKVRDLNKIEAELDKLPADSVILTTDKDAVKLTNRKKIPLELQRRLYKVPVRLHFLEEENNNKFLRILQENIEESVLR